MEQPEAWATHQAVLPSALATLLDRLHEGRRIDFRSVAALRNQHAEQLGVVQRGEHLGRDPPAPASVRSACAAIKGGKGRAPAPMQIARIALREKKSAPT